MRRSAILALAAAVNCVGVSAGDLPGPLEAGWDGEPVCEKLHEDDNLRVLRCSFPPGVGHERHYHPPHVGYVISGGIMEITDADGTRTMEIPDAYMFSNPDGIPWHEALNVGEQESTYLMIEPKQAAKQ
ncbi:hypothetical protein [Congregibacter litoralis]|uniref:Cupin domain protein n=1 Tax=Congregibacter litoralis KT71 TaxID=314285 RepID=A4A904_9GAMM|nr:hypothetical protein [Congregibacter litoralis]EAQ97546.2 Cupin domain protein [Congregibacter litoralis KT71]